MPATPKNFTERARKGFLFFCVLVATASLGQAQYHEVGIGLVGGTYTGDLSPQLRPGNLRPGGQLFYRYNTKGGGIVLRGNILFATLQANEGDLKGVPHQARGFSFSTGLAEVSALMEYNFLSYRGNDLSRSNHSPYLFLGLGYGFYQNTTTNFTAEAEPASGSVVLPLGVGYKLATSKTWNLSVEYGARLALTDGLDGLADDRTYSSSIVGDWYHVVGFSASYTFYGVRCKEPTRHW